MSENLVKTIYLGIGSNLGNRRKNIELAKFKLIQNDIIIRKSSNIYESLSWPNPNNPKFLNIVLRVSTNLSPLELMKKCKEIEIFLGRKKRSKNSPRECDIDILDYNKTNIIEKYINLPHPRMHKRNFVLIPLFEIDKNWIHPRSKQHIKSLILTLSNTDITSIKQY